MIIDIIRDAIDEHYEDNREILALAEMYEDLLSDEGSQNILKAIREHVSEKLAKECQDEGRCSECYNDDTPIMKTYLENTDADGNRGIYMTYATCPECGNDL